MSSITDLRLEPLLWVSTDSERPPVRERNERSIELALHQSGMIESCFSSSGSRAWDSGRTMIDLFRSTLFCYLTNSWVVPFICPCSGRAQDLDHGRNKMAFHMEGPVPDPTTNEDEGIYKVAELMDTLDQVERYNALARSLKMSTLITTTLINVALAISWFSCQM